MKLSRRDFITSVLATIPTTQIVARTFERSLHGFLDEAFHNEIMNDPTRATLLHYRSPEGHSRSSWTLRTDDWLDDRAAAARSNIDELARVCVGPECGSDDALLFLLTQEDIIREARWRRHRVPFFGGLSPHVQAPSILIEHHKIDSAVDAEAYVERANGIPELLAVDMQRMIASIESGCAPAAFNFTDLSSSAARTATGFDEPSNHPLVIALAAKCDSAQLHHSTRDRLSRKLQRILNEKLAPATREFGDQLLTLSLHAKGNNGSWSMPNGGEFYRSEIERHCSVTLDPDELHNWGLSETERLKSEIEQIGKTLGYRSSKMPFLRHLATSPEFYFEDDESGRTQYLRLAKRYISSISERLDLLTSQPPSVPLEVRPIDPVSAASSGRAFYLEPAADGSSPGVFFLNVEKVADGPAYQLEAVCYHEAVPGHHLQAAAAIQLKDVPQFRRQLYIGAFAEGWALYAEKFPQELGFYTDPYQNAGRLSLELFRAARVVVDTGIHHKQWGLDRSLRFMNENTGNAPDDNLTEVKRYFNWPGQALSYKVGMRHIEMLRSMAEKSQGQQFQLADFHAAVLASGSITLPLLTKKIQKFTDG